MRCAFLLLSMLAVGCGATSEAPLSFASTTKHVGCTNAGETIAGLTFSYEERFTSDAQAWVSCSIADGSRSAEWSHSWTAGETWGGDGWCELAFDLDSSAGPGKWDVAQNTSIGHAWQPVPEARALADGGTPPPPFFAQYRSAGASHDGDWVVMPCELVP